VAEAALQARQVEAIHAAQIARLNLTGLLISYHVPHQQLPLLLGLPMPVEQALAEQQAALTVVARLLAQEHGIENWAAFPTAGKAEFLAIAFDLIDSMPAPLVPHASTPP
jgi:hypothetical protein